MIRAVIVQERIDVEGITKAAASEKCGATAVFLGTVRSSNEGRDVTGIDYSSYEKMAELEMTRVLEEAQAQFGFENAVIEHRVGTLEVGDVSIAVAVAHPHRQNAIDAMRFIVDETKARATIWKLEHYADGTREWVNAGTGAPK